MKGCLVIVFLLIYIYIAIHDARFHCIPNKALVLLIAFKSLWIVMDITIFKGGILPFLIAVFGFLFVGIVCGLVRCFFLRSNKLMGAGDYKYIIVLGYCLGIESIHILCIVSVGTLLIHCFVTLLSKRKIFTDCIAAAPYFSAGAIVLTVIQVL